MSEGHRVAVYYQTQYDKTLPSNSLYGHYVSPLPLIQYITHLLLAAFHIHTKTMFLNDHLLEDPWYAQMWKDIAVMQDQGIKVIGMLGGAAPGTYECLTGEEFESYYPILASRIKQYKLDGMDLDVEQWTELSVIYRLISRLKADFGPDFIITLTPVPPALMGYMNLSGFNYTLVERIAGANISWYNAQFYNGFGDFSPKAYTDIIDHGHGLHPNRLVAISLTHSDNGGSGYVAPEDIARNVKDLAAKYGPNFGGVAAWEYFNSYPFPSQPWRWADLMKKAMAQGLAEANRAQESEQRESMKQLKVWRRDK